MALAPQVAAQVPFVDTSAFYAAPFNVQAALMQLASAAFGGAAITGAPVAGNLTVFSSASAITNGDLTGDVTTSGSTATTIANNAVSNAKAADMAEGTIKGRALAAGSGDPTDLTAAQAAAVLQGDGTDIDLCGFRGVPQHSFSANTTIAASDCGKTLYHPASDANARTLTIDSNANLALEVGFTFTIINDTTEVVTLAITADTLVQAGTGTTGSVSLALNALVTVTKVTATRWYVIGAGMS